MFLHYISSLDTLIVTLFMMSLYFPILEYLEAKALNCNLAF